MLTATALLLAAILDVTAAPYNAVGDGVTNDAPAVQAAIDAAAPGDTILFPAGATYLIPGYPGIKVKGKLTLSAYGATLTQGPNVGGSGAFGRNRMFENIPDASEVKFLGGTFIGSRVPVGGMQWSIGIRLDRCVNCIIQDATLLDWYTDGVYLGGNPPGYTFVEIQRVRISNSKRNAMSIAAGVKVRIYASTFENTNCSSDAPGGICTAFEANMPRCGIDFEPNNALDIIDDVVVVDSVFQNNEGMGIFLQGKGLGKKYVFANNTFLNNKDIQFAANQVEDVVIAFNKTTGGRIGLSMGNNLRNVVLFGNEVSTTTGNGINVAGVRDAFFASNTVNGEKVAYINVALMDALIGDVCIRPFQ